MEQTQRAENFGPPERKDFLILPLHVHVLTAADHPDIDCKLADSDVERIIGKANRIWSAAGIVFRVASQEHEPAVELEAFVAHRDAAEAGALGYYRMLSPRDTRDLPGLHVYYIHHFPVNGVFLGGNVCFIQETAQLKKVEGGIDEPIPRVTSHEIGHALGAAAPAGHHEPDASGTTGTLLNASEIARARATAGKMAGVMTPAECEAAAVEARKKGDAAAAKQYRRGDESRGRAITRIGWHGRTAAFPPSPGPAHPGGPCGPAANRLVAK